MTDDERRELKVPADSFEFTKDGQLIVNNERIAKSIQDAGLERGAKPTDGGVGVGVVVSRSF